MHSHEINGFVGYGSANPRFERTLALIVEPLDGSQDLHETILHHILHIIAVRDLPQSC